MTALLMLAWGLLCSVYGALMLSRADTIPQWFEASLAILIATVSLGFAFVLDALRKVRGETLRCILVPLLLSSLFLPVAESVHAEAGSYHPSVSVFFSPRGGCTEAVVREIGAAQTEILLQAYGFSSAPIAKALIEAKKRGVVVKAVLDKSNETARYSSATFLANAGIPVLIDDKHAIAHNKIMIIDKTTVITGSFNFTKAAEESNAENLLILKAAPDLATTYEQNWAAHAAHAHPYKNASTQAPTETRDPGLITAEIRGNKNSKVYQLPSCPWYNQSKPENVVTFASEAAAQNAGYHKAKNCR